jgi:hypothetical protein
MIVVPAWVEKEEPAGFLVIFGSEPSSDASSEWVSRESVEKCVYSDLTSRKGTKRMAMLLMNEEKLPEKIKQILEGKK